MAAIVPVTPNAFKTLEQWLKWQESLHVTEVELGLERCIEVARAMALARPAPVVVTVAGTNGKGSSVAMLDAIWRAAGYRTGVYTSPHLLRYNERIQIDGQAATDAAICSAFERIERVRNDSPLTYFEFGTLAALSLFERAELDVAILEVGLGGRLDAVNVVDADAALITSIGIDHVEFLGHNRDAIALEKAGILRKSRPAVCSDPDVPKSLRDYAASLPTQLDLLGRDYRYADDGESWTWWRDGSVITGLPKPALSGDYQLANAAGVLRIIDLFGDRLPVAETALSDGLRSVDLAARFQRIPGSVETIVDVAHNAQAVEVFVETLQTTPAVPRTHVILGMLKVKDRESVIRLLDPIADSWHLATIAGRRGATAEQLYETLQRVAGRSRRATIHESVAAAYSCAMAQANPGDRVLALGSFLVAAEVLASGNRAD